jgi:hypothetical protein
MVIIIAEPDEACCEKSHRRTVRYSQIEAPIQADYSCHQRLRKLPDCRKPLGQRLLTLSLAAVRAGTGLHRHRPRFSSP